MNQEARRTRRSDPALVQGQEGGIQGPAQGTGAADQGDDQDREARDAPAAHAKHTLAPETEAGDHKVDPEIKREMTLEGRDLKRHQRATVQPGGHAVRIEGTGEVAAPADLLKSLQSGKSPGLHLLADTRRKRKGIKNGKEIAKVKKSTDMKSVNTPAARRRKVKTRTRKRKRKKTKSGTGSRMVIKEILRSPGIMMKRNKVMTARKSESTGRTRMTRLFPLILKATVERRRQSRPKSMVVMITMMRWTSVTEESLLFPLKNHQICMFPNE